MNQRSFFLDFFIRYYLVCSLYRYFEFESIKTQRKGGYFLVVKSTNRGYIFYPCTSIILSEPLPRTLFTGIYYFLLRTVVPLLVATVATLPNVANIFAAATINAFIFSFPPKATSLCGHNVLANRVGLLHI